MVKHKITNREKNIIISTLIFVIVGALLSTPFEKIIDYVVYGTGSNIQPLILKIIGGITLMIVAFYYLDLG